MDLIRRAVAAMADRREALLAAPSRQSLRLAIWSDKGAIPAAEVDRLRPLWGRYFEPTPATNPEPTPAAE